MSTPAESNFMSLRRLGDRGRELVRQRPPDPYPRASGPAPDLEELRRRRDEIMQVAAPHGARTVQIFGSIARGDARSGSDLDVLVDMCDRPSLLEQAGLQSGLEDLLGCPVHVLTTGALRRSRQQIREWIEREAVPL